MTDQEKIDELWRKLDVFHQENANLKAQCAHQEELIKQKDFQISRQQETERQLIQELQRLGKEINAARIAAANSVREYIAANKP